MNIKIYNPGADAIFPVTSTIIYGDEDAILVDAQFQRQYALKLVEEIKETGKNLKTVYISHSDPDYYFALDVIKTAFPNARIVSTAQTAYLISASKDEKLAVWKDQLKTDAPDELIVPEAIEELPDLEGNKIEIIRTPNDPAHSFLWIPFLKTVLGGISVAGGIHLWMADTQNSAAIDEWIGQIDRMKSLNPEKVIPAHYVESDSSPEALDFVKGYLEDFKQAAADKNATEIAAVMESKYPNLADKEHLAMGAKVFKGEMPWELKSPYPPIERHLTVEFGEYKYDLNFKDNKTMTFTGIEGADQGVTDTVEYTAVEVSQNLFMVYWHEPKIGANVVHLQDFNKNIIYTNIASPDGAFLHLKGKLTLK